MTGIDQRAAANLGAGAAHRDPASLEVLERVRALLPAIRERADDAEQLRVLPQQTLVDLEQAGFFRLLQPQQWGGYESDPVTYYTAVRDLASACGATGWTAGIVGVHNWHLAQFDQQAQEDVWGGDPNVRISSSYAPMGTGEVVDGGYKVNGTWAWSSGSAHADWVVVGGPVIKDGRAVDFVSYLIPRADYRIDDVWHVVGLKGTGSNNIVVEDAFVPAHRALSFKRMTDHTAPGLEQNTGALYRMPWGTIHPTVITTPIVGMAYGVYEAHVAHQGKRVRAAYAGEKATDDPFAKVRVAEAASDIDAAWRQLSGNLAEEYETVLAGEQVPMTVRLTARRDQVRATARAIAAIDRLFESSGATALQSGTTIQRLWRDAHAGRVHAANDAERAYVMYGGAEFGLPINDSMV